MSQTFRASALVPRGFVVDEVMNDGASALITVRSIETASVCPGCGTRSGRAHSRYYRRLADLPTAGRPVRLVVRARRFYCQAVLCGQRVFAERFDADVLAPWARRTARLDHIVHHLGLALGGRPAARFARRLMVPVSKDTLLRVIRRRGCPPFAPPAVIGIDDWAWQRNQRYGTLICDLERRRTIALLPDRELATASAWLSQQPQIALIARDRGGAYALAAAKALPDATQVADRWHLMENASCAFLDAVRKLSTPERRCIGAPEQRCIGGERQKAPAGAFWRFGAMSAAKGLAEACRYEARTPWAGLSVSAKPSRWVDRPDLGQIEIADSLNVPTTS